MQLPEPTEPERPVPPAAAEPAAVPPLEALPPHAHRLDAPPPGEYPVPAQPVQYVQPVRPVENVQPVVPVQPVEVVQPVQYVATAEARALRTWRIRRIIYTVVGIVTVLILVRVLLRLLGANPDAPFSQFWYALTFPFVAPFEGVFPEPSYRSSALELSSLLAILIYWLLAWIAVRVVRLANRTPTPEA